MDEFHVSKLGVFKFWIHAGSFSGVHIYHISTEIKESVIDILTNHIMLYSPDIDEIHITLDGGRVYKVCTSSDPFC